MCNSSRREKEKPKEGRTNLLEEEEPPLEEPETYGMYALRSRANHPIEVTVTLNGVETTMEVDTGASRSIISEATYQKLWYKNQPIIERSSVHIQTYTGEELDICGKIQVQLVHNGQQASVTLLVVKGDGPSLIGRDWLSKLRLDWSKIHHLRAAEGLNRILDKRAEVFKEELGTLKGMKVSLHVDQNAHPRFCRARSVPFILKDKIEAELERLLGEGIIESMQFSKWAAPIVPVLKSDGKIRICGDYKTTVNQVSETELYPLPKIEDLFSNLAGGKLFSKLDLSHAYQQLLLDDKSKDYVVINTHKGLFRYTRLPFGIASAPAIFQRTMESLLQGIPGVAVYLDDILVSGKSEEKHLETLDLVLKRMEDAGLRLKRNKCHFMTPSVEYLGHRIDRDGLHPTDEKVRAIRDAPNPRDVTELRSFLGLINYYGKFLPQLSTVLAPLYRLLRKDERWSWKAEQIKAFKKAKSLLQEAPVLVHYDNTKEIILACDASPYGVGAVISHRMDDGSERPIGYASSSLSPAEKKYSQLEKEALAIIFGVKKFHQYLYGLRFTIYTDHQPLKHLFNSTRPVPVMASSRIQRWAMTLAAYHYSIGYKPGQHHENADGLSRLPLQEAPGTVPMPEDVVQVLCQIESTTIKAAQIRSWTDRDPTLAKVKRYCMAHWPQHCQDVQMRPYYQRRMEISVQDGCLLWGSRIIIPPQGRAHVLSILHETHQGVSRMKSLARCYVWWPKLDQAIEEMVKTCEPCQLSRPLPAVAPLHPWEFPKQPWSRLHIDYAGPFLGKMFLVLVDAFSKWLEVHITPSTSSTATIDKLRQIFATHGLPETIVSDNATSFTSAEFQQFVRENGIHHITSAPYHPSSNGLAERAVQTFKQGIQRISEGTIETKLARFLFQYRITPHSVTGMSPAQLLMNRRPRSRLDLLYPDIASQVKQHQQKQQQYHNVHAKARQFQVGEGVYIRQFLHNQKETWITAEICELTGPLSFKVKLRNGQIIRMITSVNVVARKEILQYHLIC